MKMYVTYNEKTIIAYDHGGPQWWCTGFNPAYQNPNINNMTVKYFVGFSDPNMYQAFKNSVAGKSWTFYDLYNMAVLVF